MWEMSQWVDDGEMPNFNEMNASDIAGAYIGNGCYKDGPRCTDARCKVWIETDGNPCCGEAGVCFYTGAFCGCGPKCCIGCPLCPCDQTCCGPDVWIVPGQLLQFIRDRRGTKVGYTHEAGRAAAFTPRCFSCCLCFHGCAYEKAPEPQAMQQV